MSKKVSFSGFGDMPPVAVSQESMSFNATGSWRYLRPVYSEKLAPCRHLCPAGTDIPRVLALIAEEKFEEAYHLIWKTNPLPAICGRVCYHPCESSCTRSGIDAGVSVQALERFVSEMCLDLQPDLPSVRNSGKKVAVVGSGPAGLSCATFLARDGVSVTVFETEERPGGMLRIGIPSYRLPRKILDRELEKIARLGVAFECNCKVGKDLTFASLRRNYDAVFVATGAHSSRIPPGLRDSRDCIMTGLDFLKATNLSTPPEIGKLVVVVGGGNTAMDAARTAVRLGAQPVVVYRRSREEMPAGDEEIREAEEEGVNFVFLASPTAVKRNSRGVEIELQEMVLGPPDRSGRRRPIPVSGSSFTLETDTVILAIGEDADLSLLSTHEADPGVFVGGDAQTGSSTVPEAIAAGRQAALAILRYVGVKASASATLSKPASHFSLDAVNPDYFAVFPRIEPHRIDVETRISGFPEIVQTISSPEAVQEAQRCISCGVCNECDTCWLYCPDGAISRVDGGYSIDLNYCKGCGICVQECPRGVISLVQEES
jgi:NADPH-dependent glutamate synthase beta subunit-like oxidoreductase